MERKNTSRKYNYIKCNNNYLIILIFNFLIICINQITSSNKLILFLDDNKILLKVKGKGNDLVKILSSDYNNYMPTSYYLNNGQEPINFSGKSITLPDSVNKVELIFGTNVQNCNSMFKGCSDILEIDLSNFISSDVQDINRMFEDCTSLKNIIFGNFKTSQMNALENVFYGCSSLGSLDLSNFDVSHITGFNHVFDGCDSLKYIDFTNFNPSSIEFFSSSMLDGDCEKLEFMNFKNSNAGYAKLGRYFVNILRHSANNIVFCVDASEITLINNAIKVINLVICPNIISDCSNWRYHQKINTFRSIFFCLDNCLSSGKCNNLTDFEYKNHIKEKMTSFVDSSKIINGSNFLASVMFSNEINPKEQLKKGISAFDLGNCTNVLKEYYKIPDEENLIILNMEINEKNENDINSDKSFILGKKTNLEIYDNLGQKLELSICKEDIKIFKYIGDINKFDLNLAKDLSEQGIDIFNPENEFFNDICYNYNNSIGKDIILNDRRNDIYQNVSFCQYGCIYGGMNYSLMAPNCICGPIFLQEEYNNLTYDDINSISFKEIKKAFLSNLYNFNFEILKCYNLVFNEKIIVTNIGFYCLFLMFILQIIFFIIYLIKKLKPIKLYMKNLKHQKNNDNKKDINIKNNKSYKKIDNIKSNPTSKNKKELKSKNKLKLKRSINNLLSKSKNNSSKNSFNLKKNLTIYNKKNQKEGNFLMNGIKGETNNKLIKIVNINNNSIFNIKSDKRGFLNHPKELKGNNNLNKIKYLPNIYDIQDMDYEEAIIYDTRGYLKMYWGFLVDTQIILGTFCTDNHLDLFVIKLSFFIFTFQISFFLNSFFYTDEYISNAYHNNGILEFISGLPKSVYSYIATLITTNLLRILSNSKNELMNLIKANLKYQKYLNLINIKLTKLRNKLIIYFILLFLLTAFFLYYVAAFCAVYKYSQKYWFFGCLESFGIDSLVTLIICIFLALFRFISIKKNIKYLFTMTNIISTLL